MRYFASLAALPAAPEIVAALEKAAARLEPSLVALDPTKLDISEYNRRYLGDLLRNVLGMLQKYCFILAWALAEIGRPLGESALLDYGAGSGLLAVLARELGVGTVVYNDIYDVSCGDAHRIAAALGAEAAHYVLGDIDDVIEHARRQGLSFDAVVSNDVIEHVYDPARFLSRIELLSTGPLTAVMATDANPWNPWIRRARARMQLSVELEDQTDHYGRKQRDGLRAYRTVRAEMVRAHRPGLTDAEVEDLAAATRGLDEADIRRAVDAYAATGRRPDPPAHRTNTCDPATGNWAEHLLDYARMQEILGSSGFATRMVAGYVSDPRGALKRPAAVALNAAIRCLGLRVAPFIMLHARRPSPRRSDRS